MSPGLQHFVRHLPAVRIGSGSVSDIRHHEFEAVKEEYRQKLASMEAELKSEQIARQQQEARIRDLEEKLNTAQSIKVDAGTDHYTVTSENGLNTRDRNGAKVGSVARGHRFHVSQVQTGERLGRGFEQLGRNRLWGRAGLEWLALTDDSGTSMTGYVLPA